MHMLTCHYVFGCLHFDWSLGTVLQHDIQEQHILWLLGSFA